MTTIYTAWATTTETMPEADPGIGITATVDGDEKGVLDGQWSITGWTEWDEEAADDELARMGWTWSVSGSRAAGRWPHRSSAPDTHTQRGAA